MPPALSENLHSRVAAAALEGAKHRDVAEQSGARSASVSRWRVLEREQGNLRSLQAGTNWRPGRLKAHREAFLVLLEATQDPTIEELREALANTDGSVGYGPIRRFFARHGSRAEKAAHSREQGWLDVLTRRRQA